MKIFHGKGVVLRKTHYSDADIIYEIFSDQKGKISILAKGIRKQSSKNKGAMQLFSCIEYEVFTLSAQDEKNAFYRLKNASVLRSIPEIHIQSQSACSLLAEILLEFLPSAQPFPEIYQLWEYFLKHNTFSKNTVLCFSIKFFSLLGFFPEFSHASDCQTSFIGTEKIFWEREKGLFLSSSGLLDYRILSFPILKVFLFGQKRNFSDFEKIHFSSPQNREIWEIFWWFYSSQTPFLPRSKKIFEELA